MLKEAEAESEYSTLVVLVVQRPHAAMSDGVSNGKLQSLTKSLRDIESVEVQRDLFTRACMLVYDA